MSEEEPGSRKRIARVIRCFDATGRLQRWPSRRAEQIVVLWVLWSFLPGGTRFSEAEINSMLRDWHDFEDYALLRRDLCDLGLLQRTPDGRIYRRVEHEMPAEAAAVAASFNPHEEGMTATVEVGPAVYGDLDAWAAMRHAIWPDGSEAEHRAEIEASLAAPDGLSACLIARDADGPNGFAEISLRRDYVNGCKTSPVAFLEGIYVRPQTRGQGVARALIMAAETWATEKGCTEFASDAAIENIESAAMHKALGFEETQRVVYFRKVLKR